MRKLLIASLALAALSGCSNMGGYSQALTDLTTSSLVGTWAGELQCKDNPKIQKVILTFKQSDFPLIAQGQSYSKVESGKTTEHMTIQIEGEMSLAGKAYIAEKNWIVKPQSSNWALRQWSGDRVSADQINMATCGADVVLKRVSSEFITEMRPAEVFKQHGHFFTSQQASK